MDSQRRQLLTCGILAGAACADSPATPADAFFANILNRWKRSRDYALDVLRRMPEEHLHFQPTGDIWTFSQQLTHIGDGNILMAAPLRGEDRPYVGDPRDLEGAELRPHLESSFRYVEEAFRQAQQADMAATVLFMGTPEPRSELAYRILDHVAHHRGQALIYLRLKGIEPPSYPG